MGRANISYLSAAAALLLAGARGQLQPQGCASLDVTAAADSNALEPNSSELCADYCNSNGYPYIALFLQFCTCWETAPPVISTYPDVGNSDCYYNCQPPYNLEYCGGMDQDTGDSLFNLYLSPLDAAGSSTSIASASTTVAPPATTSLPEAEASSTSSPSLSSTAAADPTTSAAAALDVTPFLDPTTEVVAAVSTTIPSIPTSDPATIPSSDPLPIPTSSSDPDTTTTSTTPTIPTTSAPAAADPDLAVSSTVTITTTQRVCPACLEGAMGPAGPAPGPGSYRTLVSVMTVVTTSCRGTHVPSPPAPAPAPAPTGAFRPWDGTVVVVGGGEGGVASASAVSSVGNGVWLGGAGGGASASGAAAAAGDESGSESGSEAGDEAGAGSETGSEPGAGSEWGDTGADSGSGTDTGGSDESSGAGSPEGGADGGATTTMGGPVFAAGASFREEGWARTALALGLVFATAAFIL